METFIQVLPQVLFLGSLYSILALGYSFLHGANRFFDITYATYIVVGAYSFFVLTSLGLPFFVTLLLVYALIIVCAFLFEGVIYRKLRARNTSDVSLMLVSFGLLTIVQGVISIFFTSNLQVLNPSTNNIIIGTLTFTQTQLSTIAILIILYLVSYILLHRTKFGTHFRAISENPSLSLSVGINVERTRIKAILISACVGATAGMLFGLDSRIYPFLGIDLLFKALIAAVISGLGSPIYGIFGGFILSITENTFAWYFLSEWKDALSFVILILLLMFRPSGIVKK